MLNRRKKISIKYRRSKKGIIVVIVVFLNNSAVKAICNVTW